MRTRTYYRGPDAVVTSELFVWRTAPPKIFAVRELSKVGIARGKVDHSRPHTARAAAGSALLTVAIWPIVDTTAMLITIALAVTIPSVAVVAYWQRRPRLWEIHATYRAAAVILYASTDARVFNQVARALRRAMEDAGPSATGDEAAA